MIRDPMNDVTTITIQTSQFVHFQLRLREHISSGKQFNRIYRHELE